jgi:hypothetical protein
MDWPLRPLTMTIAKRCTGLLSLSPKFGQAINLGVPQTNKIEIIIILNYDIFLLLR